MANWAQFGHFLLGVYSLLWPAFYTLMAVCRVILRGQQMYTVIQAVHSLLYIVAKCHFFSVVTWKDLIKYLQKCEECTHFCEILYTHTHTFLLIVLDWLPFLMLQKFQNSEIACKTCPKSANAACDSITIVKIDIFKCVGGGGVWKKKCEKNCTATSSSPSVHYQTTDMHLMPVFESQQDTWAAESPLLLLN